MELKEGWELGKSGKRVHHAYASLKSGEIEGSACCSYRGCWCYIIMSVGVDCANDALLLVNVIDEDVIESILLV